jgi:hypothetical protein
MENSASLPRLARRLRYTTIAVATGLVLVSLAAALVPESRHVTVEAGGLPRGWGAAVALVTVALVVLALAQLVRMLGRIEQGERFTPGTTRDFRRFALWLLLAAITRIVLAPVIGFAHVLIARGRHFSLSLDDTDVVMLVVAAVLFLVARLFDEAARLEEDSRSIV